MGLIMIWIFLFSFSSFTFSQSNFSEIRDLNDKLPSHEGITPKEKKSIKTKKRNFERPYRIIKIEEIQKSGTHLAAAKKGSILHDLKTQEQKIVPKDTWIKVFDLEDENGFKYIQNEDGSVTWKMPGRMIESLKEDLKMYEEPRTYTPAPVITKSFFDQKINPSPELIFYSGIIHGNFMQDLFDDSNASHGVTNQYGVHLFGRWASPIQAGGVIHFEKSNYSSSSGNYITYSSLSFGPGLKSKDFNFKFPFRIQTQFRIGPMASANSKERSFNFYSNDFMSSIEIPTKNFLGEFVFGLYYQKQWLNLKNQSRSVEIESDGKTNDSYGVSLSQVFE
jgi:hypothetical protein